MHWQSSAAAIRLSRRGCSVMRCDYNRLANEHGRSGAPVPGSRLSPPSFAVLVVMGLVVLTTIHAHAQRH
jgi:hypothetical protein